MISNSDIINKIINDKRLNEHQKRLIIEANENQLLDKQILSELYFPATIEEFTEGMDYFPQSVLHYVSALLIDAELNSARALRYCQVCVGLILL